MRAALPDGAWAVERPHGFAHEPAYVPKWPVPRNTVVDRVEALLHPPAVKLMLRHPELDADVLLAHARELIGELVEVSHSSAQDALLEISAPGVSKASSLAVLCERSGIESRDVVAFGDMPNDLPMLTWAGHGVAVANAHEDVLAAADEVTASNDEAGVAQVLERLLAARRTTGATSGSIGGAARAVARDGLVPRPLTALPQVLVDGRRGQPRPAGRDDQLDGMHRARADLDLLGRAMLDQLLPLDPGHEPRGELQDAVEAQDVGDEVVGEHRQPAQITPSARRRPGPGPRRRSGRA